MYTVFDILYQSSLVVISCMNQAYISCFVRDIREALLEMLDSKTSNEFIDTE